MLNAETILNAKYVGDIFSNDKERIKCEYIELCKMWHPDLHKNSLECNNVMAKINEFYNKALDLLNQNKWEGKNYIKIICQSKKSYEIRYRTKHDFELGSMYISDRIVTYILDDDHRDFYDNGMERLNGFRYANDKMKNEFEKYLPCVLEKFVTIDGKYGVMIKKTKDLLLLKDVLEFYNRNMDDKHMAWILSSLYNLACYLDYIGISHNAITLNNYFISPQFHSGSLLGGWWYAVKQNSKMIGASNEIYRILPPKTRDNKKGTIVTDLESIRFIGRQLTNNINSLPDSFKNWLLIGSSPNAVEEYDKWNSVLDNSYGKRKFTNMNLSADNLYTKL